MTRNVDVEQKVGEEDDVPLIEELETFQHFLANSECEEARHKVFTFAKKTLEPNFR